MALLVVGLPFFSAEDMPAAPSANVAAPTFFTNGGFCPDGAFKGAPSYAVAVLCQVSDSVMAMCQPTPWPGDERPEGLSVWGSLCPADSSTGRIESTEFLAPPAMSFYVAGYAGTPGLSLRLIEVDSRQEIELTPKRTPGPEWQLNTFDVPAKWMGKRVKLVAEDQAMGPGGWLGFTEPILSYSLVAPGEIATESQQRGFCANGVYPSTTWPAGAPQKGIARWGSWCQSGDNDTGWMASRSFTADAYLTLYLAGYPGRQGLRIAVENLQNGHQLPLRIGAVPGESWQKYTFVLPPDWREQQIRLLAEDRASEPRGWLGFAGPISATGLRSQVFVALQLVGSTVLFFVVLVVPAAATCLLAVRLGVDDVVDLISIAVLTIGLVGYGSFWIYFFSRTAGLIYSYAVLVSSSLAASYIAIVDRKRLPGELVQKLIEPWPLVALAAIFVISLGLLYGGESEPISVAESRFTDWILPNDNALPKLFADDILRGKIPRPMIGDWLSSDRPPLQSGLVLWNYAWTRGKRDLPYQVIATISQLTCMIGLWTYLIACGVGRKAIALALATTLFSGFTMLNSFYTWPKLLPITFLLMMATFLLTRRYPLVRERWSAGVIVGSAAALAMLCHGGSMFAILGLVLALLVLRRLPGPRFVTAALGAATLLYVPWMLYQKYYDPPGDRLLKWHLAGMVAPHPEISFGKLLVHSYRQTSTKEIVDNKVSNFLFLGKGNIEFWKTVSPLVRTTVGHKSAARTEAIGTLKSAMYFHWLPALDFLILGPLALLLCGISRRTGSPEFLSASTLWLWIGATILLWCLMMFGPASTSVHQGTYATVIAAFAGSVLAIWAVRPLLACVVAAVHILFNLAVFVWFPPTHEAGSVTALGPPNEALGWTCALAAAGIALILWRIAVPAGKSSPAQPTGL